MSRIPCQWIIIIFVVGAVVVSTERPVVVIFIISIFI